MVHQAQVVHQLPGRVRLRVLGARHNSRVLKRIKETVACLTGVHSIDANPTTGCLLIRYARETYSDLAALFSAMSNSPELASLLELPADLEIEEVAGGLLGVFAVVGWLTGRGSPSLALMIPAAVAAAGILFITDTWPISFFEF
jgi:hypothetical protein